MCLGQETRGVARLQGKGLDAKERDERNDLHYRTLASRAAGRRNVSLAVALFIRKLYAVRIHTYTRTHVSRESTSEDARCLGFRIRLHCLWTFLPSSFQRPSFTPQDTLLWPKTCQTVWLHHGTALPSMRSTPEHLSPLFACAADKFLGPLFIPFPMQDVRRWRLSCWPPRQSPALVRELAFFLFLRLDLNTSHRHENGHPGVSWRIAVTNSLRSKSTHR